MNTVVYCMTEFFLHDRNNISDKMLKSMKNNPKSKTSNKSKQSAKSKCVNVDSKSTIKNFFKNAPSTSNVRVEEIASDNRGVYVQALKDRLKSYNGETEKEIIDNESTTIEFKSAGSDRNNGQGDDVTYSATGDQNTRQGAGIVDAATGDRNNRQVACVVVSGSDDEGSGDAVKSCDASCELLRRKYKDLKKAHFQLCHKHCEISMKYDQLVETLDTVRKAESTNAEVSDLTSSTDDVFTPNQIRILESLPLEKKKDSTFILQCIEYAYKDKTPILVNKTLYGTLEKKEFGDDGAVIVRPAKGALTPEKVIRIETLFVKRVTESKCLSAEFAERIKPTNIHRLIASAIINVSNKENPKQTKKNVNLNL